MAFLDNTMKRCRQIWSGKRGDLDIYVDRVWSTTMKKHFYILNLCRGGLVLKEKVFTHREDALLDASTYVM